MNFIEQRKLRHSNHIPTSIVPDECNKKINSASSGECFLDDKIGDMDDFMNASKLFDSSVTSTRNEESSTKKKDKDLRKLYGCGICCQSFSTKDETYTASAVTD